MSNTAIIVRPQTSPPLHVLEVDGPRHKYYRRGEGDYYLCTDNHPYICHLYFNSEMAGRETHDPRLAHWSAYWQIYQNNDGSMEVVACRPTDSEAIHGDLIGALGSFIQLENHTRLALRNGLRLARLLLRADPDAGLYVFANELAGIQDITSNIPIRIL